MSEALERLANAAERWSDAEADARVGDLARQEGLDPRSRLGLALYHLFNCARMVAEERRRSRGIIEQPASARPAPCGPGHSPMCLVACDTHPNPHHWQNLTCVNPRCAGGEHHRPEGR